MKTLYKLTQLARNNAGEVAWAGVEHFNHLENKIDLPLAMPQQACDELWMFVKNNWGELKYAVVEHTGFCKDGYTPIDGKVIHVSLEPKIHDGN